MTSIRDRAWQEWVESEEGRKAGVHDWGLRAAFDAGVHHGIEYANRSLNYEGLCDLAKNLVALLHLDPEDIFTEVDIESRERRAMNVLGEVIHEDECPCDGHKCGYDCKQCECSEEWKTADPLCSPERAR